VQQLRKFSITYFYHELNYQKNVKGYFFDSPCTATGMSVKNVPLEKN